jgi:hypothetical protein
MTLFICGFYRPQSTFLETYDQAMPTSEMYVTSQITQSSSITL